MLALEIKYFAQGYGLWKLQIYIDWYVFLTDNAGGYDLSNVENKIEIDRLEPELLMFLYAPPNWKLARRCLFL